MKRPKIHSSHDLDRLCGLVFFAQLMDELLFHHTVDSHKAPALNTVSRVHEFRALAAREHFENQSVRSLGAVLDELDWSLKNDPVLVGDDKIAASKLFDAVKSPEQTIGKAYDKVGVLMLHLRRYWPKLKDQLLATVPGGKEKQKIQALAIAFASHVELLGFSRPFVYFLTQRDLLKKLELDQLIDPEVVLTNFLNRFDAPRRKWSLVYRGSKDFFDLAGFTEPFGFSVTREAPELDVSPPFREKRFLGGSREFPAYLIFEFEEMDCFAAREFSDSMIEAMVGVCKFHIHLLTSKLNPTCLGFDHAEKSYVLIKPPQNPMTCRSNESKDASAEIEQTIDILRGRHLTPQSTRSFSNALNYHRAALETNMPENQLLDLWATLEGFLPQPEIGGNRIAHYLNLLVPALVITYPEKIFRYMADCLAFAGSGVRPFIEALPIEGDFFEKCTCLLTTNEYHAERVDLLAKLDGHPLLRFRVDRIYRQFRSKRAVLAALEMHKKKVQWHVQRIYTMRNLIMHSANSLPYLKTLVENLHSYIDILIPAITKLAVVADTRVNIDAAIQLLLFHEKTMLSDLRNGKDEECRLENYHQIIFGLQNPLSPFQGIK